MTFSEAVKTVIRKTFVIQGRASRSEYWWWLLFILIIYIAMAYIIPTMVLRAAHTTNQFIGLFAWFFGSAIAGFTFNLITIIPTTSVGIRRMHDIGKSGWWCLFDFIPRAFALLSGLIFFSIIMGIKIDGILNIMSPKTIINSTYLMYASHVVFWILCLFESQPNENQYGENPNALPNTENTSE
ncbi:MAG: DUF805 domain-containing protein [Neisseriaceae bacterium]|nr:DUF805 domain-containing protein [Neisseriaceae bacterium]